MSRKKKVFIKTVDSCGGAVERLLHPYGPLLESSLSTSHIIREIVTDSNRQVGATRRKMEYEFNRRCIGENVEIIEELVSLMHKRGSGFIFPI
jgi:hypothetical protein